MRPKPHTLAALLLALALAFAGPARAAPPDPYRVAGVPVDATAESAVAARAQALEAGQREGLRQVLRRLTLPEDADRLPAADGQAIEQFVQSYEIASERLGPTRYLASLNVAYAPDRVRALLRRSGVPFVERRPEPVLVLPVLRAGDGGVDLWGEANPWRAAWNEEGAAASGLVELRLPLGDAGDASTATPGAVTGGDAGALAALGERYGAPLVVLAEARPVVATGGETTAVELEVRPAGATGAAAEPLLSETVTARAGEGEAALFARAAAAAVEGVELAAKRRLIVREEDVAEVRVGVPLADLRAWVQIRQKLGALPEVRGVRVDRFALSEAVVTIAYAGGLDALAGAVGRAGLSLVEESGGWQLRPAGDPGAYRPPSSALPPTP